MTGRKWVSSKKSSVDEGVILVVNGAQLCTASAIRAVNRISCTLANSTKITGRGGGRNEGGTGREESGSRVCSVSPSFDR